MATATRERTATATDGRVLLRNVSWATYEALLAAHLDASVPHFTYDRGELEIVSPSLPHEKDNRALAQVVEVVAEELAIDTVNVGSMTFKRADVQRGFEPDTGFYIQHEADVGERTQIDLTIDPPPDLVIEIEITNPLLDKRSLYAAMGVPEIWVSDGRGVAILLLADGRYADAHVSSALPLLNRDVLGRFVAESRSLKRTAWLKRLREWARTTQAESGTH